ncbi:GNAT family N-acetyltransferase [Rubellimicrobium rubrum]|nr:GNAT family N-acyltransferase [Rubellimicrobium rubrum]
MSPLALRIAETKPEIASAQTLRFSVFVTEMGGRGGDQTDVGRGIEADRFDQHCRHLLLLDTLRDNRVVGTTRVLTVEGARKAGRFASEEEFDLFALRKSGRVLLEIGRTCLHPEYRGGGAMQRLWQGVAGVVADEGAEILFGLASFPFDDPTSLAKPLTNLWQQHLAPESLRPQSRRPFAVPIIQPKHVDRREAILRTPSLVKAYLRLGGLVGEGAFHDPAFNCVDVCMVLDTARLTATSRALYAGERA